MFSMSKSYPMVGSSKNVSYKKSSKTYKITIVIFFIIIVSTVTV